MSTDKKALKELLPEAPDGWYWHITDRGMARQYIGGVYTVELRKKVGLIFYSVAYWEVVHVGDVKAQGELPAILNTARKIMYQYDKKYVSNTKRLRGTY